MHSVDHNREEPDDLQEHPMDDAVRASGLYQSSVLGTAFERAPIGMVVKDAEGRLLQSNPAFRRMLGYEAEDLRGVLRRDFTHPEDAEKDAGLYSDLLRGGRESFQIDKRYLKKGGGVMWGRFSASRIEGSEDEPYRVLGVVEDISELKWAEDDLGVSERRFRSVVEQSPLSIHIFEPDGRSIRANESWNELWYLGEGEEPEGANVFEDDQLRVAGLLPYVKDGAAGIAGKIPPLLFDPARAGREGEPRWLEGVVYPLRDASKETTEVTLMLNDITELKELEDTLTYRALHDPLTDLPNRVLFLDRLSQAFARLERESESVAGHGPRRSGIALLFLDLDDLKRVNDSLGHEAGDELLVQAAGRFGIRLRPADTLARLSGDEFVILLEDAGQEAAVQAAERVVREVGTAFTVAGQELFVSISMGIALSGQERTADGRSASELATALLREADLAMYEAKQQGKASYVVYEERMGREAGARLEREGDLRRALVQDEIEVFYQPKVSVLHGGVVAVEALARWRHPERGLVLPAEFIPLAERTGLIVELGYQVLKSALEQAALWRLGGPQTLAQDSPDALAPNEVVPVVWVNLSARQFRDPNLLSRISAILDETGVEPHALGLEITESILVEDASLSVQLLEDLRRLGIKLAVDDFGTGYSSLSYLTRLPVDYLKVDRSFVASLSDNGNSNGSATIVAAVVAIARAIGMKVVAEGVETTEQLDRLKEMGCDLAQGYHFTRPLPAGEATAYLLAARAGSA